MLALWILALPIDASALGVGRLPQSVAFGQPLDLAIPLRIDPGEPPPCVRADIHIGERRLAEAAVQVSLEPGGVLRIRSAHRVREPLVGVALWLGCGATAPTRFTLLADPPVPQAAADRGNRPAAGATGTAQLGGLLSDGPNAARVLPAAVTGPAAPPGADVLPVIDARVAALEHGLGEARAEAARYHGRADELQQRLARLQAREALLPILAAALAATAGFAAWLGLRLRRLQRDAAAAPRTAAAVRGDGRRNVPPRLPVQQGDSGAPKVGPRPALVSVEALIDLEQQAEFFMLLGEQDAAVALLAAQLDAQAAVLPYLKLFEIHRRRQDRAAFGALRRRFQRQFGAAAPAWDDAAAPTRDLLDHPAVLARLQAAWPVPRQALADIEKLLMGGRGVEVLGLAACRDAMLLYGVARELTEADERDAAAVDLLLPLQPAEFAATAPLPFVAHAAAGPTAPAEEAAASLDLDLRDSAAPARRGG